MCGRCACWRLRSSRALNDPLCVMSVWGKIEGTRPQESLKAQSKHILKCGTCLQIYFEDEKMFYPLSTAVEEAKTPPRDILTQSRSTKIFSMYFGSI